MWAVAKGMEWEFCPEHGPLCCDLRPVDIDDSCCCRDKHNHRILLSEHSGSDLGAPGSAPVGDSPTDGAKGPQIFDTSEVRVTSPSGGAKGRKLAEMSGIDPRALLRVAEVSGYGARKYEDRHNFRKGYDWSLSYDAAQRHLMAFWSGEDIDESGHPHLAHAAWHLLALLSFAEEHPEYDDRVRHAEG